MNKCVIDVKIVKFKPTTYPDDFTLSTYHLNILGHFSAAADDDQWHMHDPKGPVNIYWVVGTSAFQIFSLKKSMSYHKK